MRRLHGKKRIGSTTSGLWPDWEMAIAKALRTCKVRYLKVTKDIGRRRRYVRDGT